MWAEAAIGFWVGDPILAVGAVRACGGTAIGWFYTALGGCHL